MPEQEVDLTNNDVSFWGFPLLCSRSSRLHLSDLGLETDSLPSGPSFIGLDHAKAMDLCENPEWQYLHGFTAWAGPRPTLLNPIFSFASLSITSDLLATPLEQFADGDLNEADVPKWAEKKYDKVLWKGRTTGVWFDAVTRWRSSQRMRLHSLGTATTGSRKVRFSEPLESDTDDDDEGLVKLVEKDVPLETLNRRYLNASFVGKLEQCTVADGSCEAIPKEIEFGPYIDWPEQNMYKVGRSGPNGLCEASSCWIGSTSWTSTVTRGAVGSAGYWRLTRLSSRRLSGQNGADVTPRNVTGCPADLPFRFLRTGTATTSSLGTTTSRPGSTTRTCTTSWPFSPATSTAGEATTRLRRRSRRTGKSSSGIIGGPRTSKPVRSLLSPSSPRLTVKRLAADTWRMYLEWARVSSDDRTSMDFVLDE